MQDNCHDFVSDVGQLAEIADGFLDVIDAVGNEVTKEKVKAIGARNRLQTIAKEREAQVTDFTTTLRALVSDATLSR